LPAGGGALVFEAGDGADDREWPIQVKQLMSDVPNIGKKPSRSDSDI